MSIPWTTLQGASLQDPRICMELEAAIPFYYYGKPYSTIQSGEIEGGGVWDRYVNLIGGLFSESSPTETNPFSAFNDSSPPPGWTYAHFVAFNTSGLGGVRTFSSGGYGLGSIFLSGLFEAAHITATSPAYPINQAAIAALFASYLAPYYSAPDLSTDDELYSKILALRNFADEAWALSW
jgi:hypothetical protein